MNNKEIITELLLENIILMKQNNRYIEELKEKVQENSLLKISLEKKNEEETIQLKANDSLQAEQYTDLKKFVTDTLSSKIVDIKKDIEKESNDELKEEIKKLKSIIDIYSEKITDLEKIINAKKKLTVVTLNEDEKKFIESKEKIPLLFTIENSNHTNKVIYFNKTFLTEKDEYCFYNRTYNNTINSITLYDKHYQLFHAGVLTLFKELLKKLYSRYPKISCYVFFDSYKIQDDKFIWEKGNFYEEDELSYWTNIMPLNYIRKEIPIVDKYSKYLKVLVEYETAILFYYDLNFNYTVHMNDDCERYFITK